jgi:hypothetical protein
LEVKEFTGSSIPSAFRCAAQWLERNNDYDLESVAFDKATKTVTLQATKTERWRINIESREGHFDWLHPERMQYNYIIRVNDEKPISVTLNEEYNYWWGGNCADAIGILEEYLKQTLWSSQRKDIEEWLRRLNAYWDGDDENES